MEGFRKKRFLSYKGLWLLIILIIIIIGALVFDNWGKLLNDEVDGMTTITGFFSCIPLRDIDAVEEGACNLGVRSRNGAYYGFDVSRVQDANTDLKVDDTIAVTGTLMPESEVLTSEWIKYNIKGVIKVNTLLRTR